MGHWPKEKVWSEFVSIKPYLVFYHFVWVDGWSRESFLDLNLYQVKSGVISFWVGQLVGWVVLRKKLRSEFVSSQIWCYVISESRRKGGGGL